MRCERWLEKRSSRPPPNSILRNIVLESVDMIVVMWFQGVAHNRTATGPLLLQKTPKETALTSRRQLSAQTFPPVLSLHAENPQYSLVGVTGVGSEVRKTFQSIVTLISRSTQTLSHRALLMCLTIHLL